MGFVHSDIRLVRCWLCICILLGCGSKEPVLIGFVGGTSGRVADLGISGRDAVQLAVETCNREGGVNGRPVQLLIRNGEQNPDLARRAVKVLIEQGVAAIVGPMTSDMAVSVVPILNEARIPTLSPTATTQHLSGRDDFFFRVCATAHEYATKLANYHISNRDMRRVAAAYDLNNRSFCENWLTNFKAPFIANGGEILPAIGFKTGESFSFLELAVNPISEDHGGETGVPSAFIRNC